MRRNGAAPRFGGVPRRGAPQAQPPPLQVWLQAPDVEQPWWQWPPLQAIEQVAPSVQLMLQLPPLHDRLQVECPEHVKLHPPPAQLNEQFSLPLQRCAQCPFGQAALRACCASAVEDRPAMAAPVAVAKRAETVMTAM